jgi:cytochrome c biogenesis protein CcmG, thiol:disulfide interchange protein DsbE
MKIFKRFLSAFFVVVLASALYFPIPAVQAAISYCSVEVQPHTVYVDSSSALQFTFTNTDAQAIQWIQVTIPQGYFTVSGASASGWNNNITSDYVTFTDGSVANGQSLTFTINATASSPFAPVAWNVQMSDDSGGASAIYCDGDTTVDAQYPQAPMISNIQLSNLSTNSVTIGWDTDIASTSRVYYGTTNSYGSATSINNTLVTGHAATLTGLSANTGYHFQIESTSGDDATGLSDDNTFLTPVVESDENSTPVTPATKIPIKIVPTEQVPPTVELTTTLKGAYKTVPTLTGQAADNEALAGIDYSIDGGKNWLPVDQVKGLGSAKATFSFTPQNLQDGNYDIVARAIDTSGNQASTPIQTLIIDQLPPQVGGAVFAVGPQILEPRDDGLITTMSDIDHKLTISSIGGATSISLGLLPEGSKTETGTFTLTKATATGLWSGIVSLGRPGTFQLVAHSIDGAGNKTDRVIARVQALAPARLVEKSGDDAIVDATATIYYREPDSNQWVVWDSSAYGQSNPQKTDKSGQFHFLVPAGTYYVKVAAKGHKLFMSKSFTTNNTLPVSSIIRLAKQRSLHIWRWNLTLPSFAVQQAVLDENIMKPKSVTPKATGLIAPAFTLTSTKGRSVRPVDLAGKPTVLSFISSWSPKASEQLPELVSAQNANKDLAIMPVFVQEGVQKTSAYLRIGKYDIEALADPTGSTVPTYNIQALPVHYFLDRHGFVKKVMVGVLSREEILKEMVL